MEEMIKEEGNGSEVGETAPDGMPNQHRNFRDHRRGGGRGGDRGRGEPHRGERKDMVRERLAHVGGPTTNLQCREGGEPKKFTGRCRLFVGNLPSSVTEDDFKKLFEAFGEVAEVFLNRQKGFGFVKLDTRQNAESAKAALDFSLRDGKYLRVRFATHGAALKVKNLTPWVSNELLEAAFSIFGEVERAIVIVDDRGRPVGEGIIEYSRKQAAQTALKRCIDGCFLLTGSPRPVLVEPLDQRDEEDGLPEKNFQKSNKQYLKEREIGPRLAEQGTFEYEFANRWKKLYDVERQKREHLEKEIIEARQQLEDQQEYSIYEHETNLLREKLRMMEEQSSLLQRERDMRRDEDRRREEQRRQEDMMLRQQQEEILRRRTADEMRRRQEDNLMMQASALTDMLDRQEAALRSMQGSGGMNSGDPSNNVSGYDMTPAGPGGPGGQGNMMQGNNMGMASRQSRFDQPPPGIGGPSGPPMNHGSMGGPQMQQMGNMRGGGPRDMRGSPRDMMDRRDPRDDYPMDNKRRRY